MEIIMPHYITEDMVKAISKMLIQLVDKPNFPDIEYLQKMIDEGASHMFLAFEEGIIIGTLTLVIYRIPSGEKAWIEDVIVENESRGKGVAKQLLEAAFDVVRSKGIQKIDLTSSDWREKAHQLYYNTGFEKRKTSVFRKIII